MKWRSDLVADHLPIPQEESQYQPKVGCEIARIPYHYDPRVRSSIKQQTARDCSKGK
ncbi:MAG TPA: hypothetical protein VE863_19810 [Pyrinomonadaceae bacterium]|nr:hypothetical protein [Pyrinomonadaceae bacterium]